jgi:hypothetical protein
MAMSKQRSPERITFLTDLLLTAMYHQGHGFQRVLDSSYEEDGSAFALIKDPEDESDETLRVDLDTMAHGLSVISNAVKRVDPRFPDDGEVYHNAKTGERLGLGEHIRREIMLADETNDAGSIDLIAALAVLECALFGKVVYA